MNLQNLDLNLLVVLDALLSDRCVSRAAQRLNLSQPALSASLKRLRTAMQDPLLVRDGLHMVLTPRAEQLIEPLRSILNEIERFVAPPEAFDPSQIQRTIRIATNDYGSFVLIPLLLNRWKAIAPGIDVEVWEMGRSDAIADQAIDLWICDQWSLRGYPCQEVLFSESFTCLVRQGHPRIRSKLSLEQYLAEEHVLVSPRGRVLGNVDAALAELGESRRRVRLTLPHVLAVPAAIAATDCIVTLATRITKRFAADYGLNRLSPPIVLSEFEIAMAWSVRTANEPISQWLRTELRGICEHLNEQ